MRIHTSYFGALRRLPSDYIPVAICGRMVFPWNGLRYPKLAPKIGFFTEWKKNHDNDFYIRHFKEEVLSQLDRNKVLEELYAITGGGKVDDKNVVLVCYERPEEFCHRHLVAEWLSEVLPYTIKECV